jgi:hypothetical protein
VIETPATYAPHIWCLLHDSRLVSLHVLADVMIVLAYFAIPVALFSCARRRDLPFRGMLLWFGAFTILCGFTHMGNIVEIWHPAYWLTAVLKFITGMVSWITLVKILKVLPQMFRLPSLAELERVRQYMLRPQVERMDEVVRELDKITHVMALLTHTPKMGGD